MAIRLVCYRITVLSEQFGIAEKGGKEPARVFLKPFLKREMAVRVFLWSLETRSLNKKKEAAQ